MLDITIIFVFFYVEHFLAKDSLEIAGVFEKKAP